MLDIRKLKAAKIDDATLPNGRTVALYGCDAGGYKTVRLLRRGIAGDAEAEMPSDEQLIDAARVVLPDATADELESLDGQQLIGVLLAAAGLADEVLALIETARASAEDDPEGNAVKPGEPLDPATTTSKA